MRYGSVCSGIEAASVAWAPLGWHASFLSEIEPFPRAVLQHHFPEVPLHGDFTTIRAGDYGPIDLLVGGTPCQSFSVAGLRGGLADKRGNLALEYLRLADRKKPSWVLWENVPGVLSSGGGRDFGAFLGGLVELGYGFAYRVLDAQYFGLAQRRKRVFVVGYLGDWRRAAAVLFEPASLRGDTAPIRQARAGTAVGTLGSTSPGGGWRFGADEAAAGQLIAGTMRKDGDAHSGFEFGDGLVSHSLSAARGTSCAHAEDLETYIPVAFGDNNTAGPIDISTAVNAHGGPYGRLDFESETFIATTLRARDGARGVDSDCTDTLVPVAFHENQRGEITTNDTAGSLKVGGGKPGQGYPAILGFQSSQSGMRQVDTHATLDANNGSRRHNGAVVGSAVRRLTPRECERLQGFPDDYTLIATKATKKIEADMFAYIRRARPDISIEDAQRLAADGPRYKALGNSMAVPCMAWIGSRIAAQEAAISILRAA